MRHVDEPHSPGISVLVQTDRLMQNRRFTEAIAGYQALLVTDPQNLAALLKLGICHLLNRSEQEFLKIYGLAGERIAQAAELPGDLQSLWGKYQGLAVRVTAGALILGSLATTGSLAADPLPAGEVNPVTTTTPTGATLTPPPPAPSQQDPDLFTGHKYSGGVFLPFDKEELVILPSDHLPPQQENPTGKDTPK